ncbi:MAG TPA: hypothetical protein VJ570_11770 [Holophagaceae bacterium]|nr:hypothetical protein [Holophagaceae bacterium]
MRTLAATLLLPVLALAAGDRTETRTEALKAGSVLKVHGFNGGIKVSTWDKEEIEILADIKERDDNAIKLDVRRTANGLEVEATRPSHVGWTWHGSQGVSFTLRVPRRLEGHYRTSNGRIEARDLVGTQEFTTSNGSMLVEGVKGDVEAQTSNGSVILRSIDGRVRGGSSNGRLTLEGVKGGVDFSTSNASITASDLDGRDQGIELSTSNGSIEVGLGAAKGEIDAKTSNGSVHVDRPGVELVEMGKSWARLRVPGSTQAIRLRSSNGSIHLK